MVANRSTHTAQGSGMVLKTARPKFFRKASITSWGKDDLSMTRAVADINLKELLLVVQQQKYEDRAKAAQREISRSVSLEHQEYIRQRTERRARCLQRSREKKDFIIEWEGQGRSKWCANQAALCRYEQRLLNYELAVRATAAARQRISRAQHSTEEVKGIRWFEKNLDGLGIDPRGDIGGARGGPVPGAKALPDKETRATFHSRLRRVVLDQQFVSSKNVELMTDLRFKGNARRRGRREREHHRVKTEVFQRRAKQEADTKRSADDHLRLILNKGRERNGIAASFWERQRARNDEAAAHREHSIEMSAAEQAAFETDFNFRAVATRARHAALSEGSEIRSEAMRARRERVREEKRRCAESMCAQVAQKIVDIAMIASEVRGNQGGIPLSPTMWRHLKRWFCSADPFFTKNTPPEPQSEPSNPVLEAKAYLESRNLYRCEGSWRPREAASTNIPPPLSPLEEALSVARDVVGATGPMPREAPMHEAPPSGDDGGDAEKINMSVRLVLVGKQKNLDRVHAELGRWTNLYVCSVEKALKCALDVGADVVTSNKKGTERKGGAAGKGTNASRRKSTVVNNDSGASSGNSSSAKEAIIHAAFDPDATEEHVTAFKEAAVAYHALRKHPKKGDDPVPVAMTADLLVKHLSCNAPKGRGWILVGYPTTLMESKMLEYSLSGYIDDDVEVELGDGGRKGRKKKGGAAPPESVERPMYRQSGLDAIVNLTEIPSAQDGRACQASGVTDVNDRVGDTSASKKSVDGRAEVTTGEQSYETDNIAENICESGVPNINAAEISSCKAWWKGFEGGHLACDVHDEANEELLLETLFLLANAAQKRKKNEYQVLRQNEASAEQRSAEGTAQFLNSNETSAELKAEPSAADSFLTVPLTALLGDLRSKRRANMSRATRIRIEAVTGERNLDLQGVQSVIARAGAAGVGNAGALSLRSTNALRNMEYVCEASSLIDWAADIEYTFVRGLRNFDNRWIAICVRLEDELTEWLVHFNKTAAVPRRERDTCTGRLSDGSGGDNSLPPRWSTTLEEDGRVWDALEEFELAAGDVTDDRHASVEMITNSIDDEAAQRVRTWAKSVAKSAADLCEAERKIHLETVRTLRDLHCLIGLSSDSFVDVECIVSSARATTDALARDLAGVSRQRVFCDGDHWSLENEVRSAMDEFYLHVRMNSSPIDDLVENSNADSSSDKQRTATQQATVQVGLGTLPAHGDVAKRRPSMTLMPSVTSIDERMEEDAHVEERSNRSLTAATWLCRETYISRLRGVVARLDIAVDRCEVVVGSMLAALRRLNCRRVQLEHEAVTTTSVTVRLALEECDHVAIQSMLQNGIPLSIKDSETFAADPHVALPWGLSGLSLTQIASLCRALRSTLHASGKEGGVPDSVVPVSDLVRAVLTWSSSTVNDRRYIGSSEDNDMPPVWVDTRGGYVEALCRGIGSGTDASKVPWRRLIHSLLLGHVRSIPTLEDLRSMIYHFTCEARTQPSRSESAENTTVETGRIVASSVTTTSIVQQEHISSSMTLRVVQRCFQRIPLWFEGQEEKEEEGVANGRQPIVCGGNVGHTDAAAAIKAIYAEAWEGEDGRVDGMDLLLTLCEVPAAGRGASAPASRDSGIEDCDDDGIPFSTGLFRAFTMLANAPPPTPFQDLTTSAIRRSQAVSKVGSSHLTTCSEGLASCLRDEQDVPQKRSSDDPCVTPSLLKAILEHGGSLSPAESSSSVREAALKSARETVTLLQKLNRSSGIESAAVATGTAGKTIECEARGKDHPVEGTDGRGRSASGTVKQGEEEGVQSVRVEMSKGQQNDDTVDGSTPVEGKSRRARQEEDLVGFANGEQVSMKNDDPVEERELMLSFSEVCESETVRAWVRKGAYSLPSFEVTSGGRRISAERVG